MRALPLYSYLRGIALEDLWHDNAVCRVGQRIALADRIPRTDGIGKHCPFCAISNAGVAVTAPQPAAPLLRWPKLGARWAAAVQANG